jgi:hypothetical protein
MHKALTVAGRRLEVRKTEAALRIRTMTAVIPTPCSLPSRTSDERRLLAVPKQASVRDRIHLSSIVQTGV